MNDQIQPENKNHMLNDLLETIAGLVISVLSGAISYLFYKIFMYFALKDPNVKNIELLINEDGYFRTLKLFLICSVLLCLFFSFLLRKKKIISSNFISAFLWMLISALSFGIVIIPHVVEFFSKL